MEMCLEVNEKIMFLFLDLVMSTDLVFKKFTIHFLILNKCSFS